MDNGKEFDLPSGAKLYVSVSSYEQVMALHDALITELTGKGLGNLDIVEIQKTIKDPEASEEGLNVIVDKALGLAASKELKAAIFACAEKAVYLADGTEATSLQFKLGAPGYGVFDHPKWRDQAREDFYAICTSIVEVNLRPFVKALFSMFSAHVAKRASTQKSNTEPELAKA